MDFIECLVQKKKPWTKTTPALKLLHYTCVALTKSSPKVFLTNWKRNGDLHPSAAGSLWTAANTVLGSSFLLETPVKVIAKGILKNNSKGLKLKRKSLAFNPACVSTRTKVGHFLTGMVLLQPFVKRQCVLKQFSQKYQTIIKQTICGIIFGVKKWVYFVPNFQEMILAMMELEPFLVILPYPNRVTTKKVSFFK